MKKQRGRLFAEITVGGLLALTAAFFAVRWLIAEEQYALNRRGVLSRSYEMFISLLADYRDGQEAEIADKLSFCAAFLPLSERSEAAFERLCFDISASETDAEARERSLSYCDALLVMLSCSRSTVLSGEMPEFSAYPSETDLPASVLPNIEDDGRRYEARCAAEMLLGHPTRLRGYSYSVCGTTVYGFRTASSYAEYSAETGLLIRAVIHSGKRLYCVPNEDTAVAAAREFAAKSGYSVSEDAITERCCELISVYLGANGMRLTVGVDGEGKVCLFSATATDVCG